MSKLRITGLQRHGQVHNSRSFIICYQPQLWSYFPSLHLIYKYRERYRKGLAGLASARTQRVKGDTNAIQATGGYPKIWA